MLGHVEETRCTCRFPSATVGPHTAAEWLAQSTHVPHAAANAASGAACRSRSAAAALSAACWQKYNSAATCMVFFCAAEPSRLPSASEAKDCADTRASEDAHLAEEVQRAPQRRRRLLHHGHLLGGEPSDELPHQRRTLRRTVLCAHRRSCEHAGSTGERRGVCGRTAAPLVAKGGVPASSNRATRSAHTRKRRRGTHPTRDGRPSDVVKYAVGSLLRPQVVANACTLRATD